MDRFSFNLNQGVALPAYPVFSEDFSPLCQKRGTLYYAVGIVLRRSEKIQNYDNWVIMPEHQ